jgi:hypothetical protein
MGFFSKIAKGLKFAFSHGKKILKGIVKNPTRLLTGIDPLGTKIHNKLFGTKYKPLITQLGGATDEQFAEYEAKNGAGSLGYARSMQKIADTVAGFYAGGALMKVGGKLASQVAGKVGSAGAGGAGGGAAAAPGGAAPGPWASGYVPPNAATGIPGVAGPVPGGAAGASAGGGAGAAPAAAGGGGLLSTAKNLLTSEAGLTLMGGALQGYASDQQQRRAIDETRRYTRPFTSEEVEGISRGSQVRVPDGFLANARRIGDFLNGAPQVGASVMPPDQVAAMARGGQ